MRKLLLIVVVVAFIALVPGLARGTGIDTGFQPGRDGFGFANFGDPVGWGGVDLNALLGTGFHDEIFTHTGHCFGMAEVSIENFRRGNASFQVSMAEAMPHIDRVQTGQSFYYIADFFRAPFGEKPTNNREEYARLFARISTGMPAVLGIYSSCRSYPGHALVAYRIEQEGDRSYIYVYDPNLPATLHDYGAEPMIALFYAADGTFYYDNGHTFDEMKVDDIDGAGVGLGKALSAGLLGLPFVAALLLVRRPRSRLRP